MRKLSLILLLFLCLGCGSMRDYKGTVVDKFIQSPYVVQNGKNMIAEESKFYVIVKLDSPSRHIKINVNTDTYYNLKIGDRTCFNLYLPYYDNN